MLNAIAGVYPIDGGKIILNGQNITNLAEHGVRFIGQVFQDNVGTSPSMTIEENLHNICQPNNMTLCWG